MKQPYLVQRGKFSNNITQKGIDSIINFDYMGSAEFEFGALGKSLKRIREGESDYEAWIYTHVDHITGKPLESFVVYGSTDNLEEIDGHIKELCRETYRLKERTGLKNWCYPEQDPFKSRARGFIRTDFWWDIENDFMFFVCNKENVDAFKKVFPISI